VVVAVVLVAGWLSLFTGTLDLPADRVWTALTGGGSRVEQLVVVDRRLSRALAALLVGFALGCSGALTQSITRNPIASPDILGVVSGAGLFASLVATQPALRTLFGGLEGRGLIQVAALVGGLLTTSAILALSWRAGFDGLRLILVGLSINALALAGTSFLLTHSEVYDAAIAVQWLTGSLAPARMDDVVSLLPVVAVALVVSIALAKALGALRMGRDVTALLGTSPGRTEALSLLLAVVLASAAAAVAGPIGFVAFVAPQAALRLFGTAGPPPVAAGAVGAALVLGADLVAQRLPVELPVGVVVAVIGAPCLLYLLINTVRRESV
jgi:iron complex transport system permease protein